MKGKISFSKSFFNQHRIIDFIILLLISLAIDFLIYMIS